jgi:twitching motility protein PilJ
MTSGQDYAQLYGQAYVAYGQGSYDEAAAHIEEMANAFPEDPNVLLLQGHIYVGLEQYDQAQQKYETVLKLTDRRDLLDCADQALEQIRELKGRSQSAFLTQGAETPTRSGFSSQSKTSSVGQGNNFFSKETDFPEWNEAEHSGDWENDFDGLDWDSAVFNDADLGEPTLGQVAPSTNPFSGAMNTGKMPSNDPVDAFSSNPFAFDGASGLMDWNADSFTENASEQHDDNERTLLPEVGGESTFMVPPDLAAQSFDFANFTGRDNSSNRANGEDVPTYQPWQEDSEHNGLDSLDNVPTVQASPPLTYSERQNPDFSDNLDNLAEFDLTDIAPELPDSTMFTQENVGFSPNQSFGDGGGEDYNGESIPTVATGTPPGMRTWLKPEETMLGDLTGGSSRFVKPTVEVDPGWLGWFTNAPFKRKQIYLAIAAGVTSTLAILIVGGATGIMSPQAEPIPAKVNKPATKAPALQKTDKDAKKTSSQPLVKKQSSSSPPFFLIALASGVVIGGLVWLLSYILIRQIKETIDDLQNQFDAIYEGNFNVRAKVLSEDELGQLAQRFNYISQVILTATTEAQERATATEKAREKLQRQVIRLLDDVEGASRGDLTVQAEVTADELGAVADAFNLTIQNLCEIVQQVKRAAKQVNKNSTDSESFARNNSSDALRMAEELAVTLNSVQLMTESIQRVAENAHEAEEVAHTSSVTALKGGEAVERTVGGILQIRETVSETARKVKRLAEASQEISKIVAVISQIASRTNLLALNASIQAARAGEAGRGFAIVADEVRQLADRSAKSLKEIEQIVLQIQSETGSVMTAMEEGIQQVIDVTDKSEQSKRALEDIIEVSNRINTLVRSISGDTVKQQENSGAVAQVMQSIELIAQETSQESQRVAGSLQTLVSISRDLLTSVERFRVDKNGK